MRSVFRKYTLLLAVLALTACGGGDGNGSVQGQGSSQLNLTNTSGVDISRVQVSQISDGQVTTDQAFECANGQACSFMANAGEASQIVFFDANQKPVAAYYNYMPADYVNLRISRVMTGLYVFNQIDDATPLTTSVVAMQLAKYFSLNPSPDNTPDFYQELGQYYMNQVVKGSMTPEAFYQKVLDEAGSGSVLPSGTVNYAFNNATMYQTLLAIVNRNFAISPVHAASVCSVVGNLFDASGGVAAAVFAWTEVMSAGIAGPLLNVAGEIFGSNCDDGTGAKLDAMSNQLSLMQGQLKNIESDLQGVKQYLESQNANFAMVQLNTYVQDMNKAFSNYNAVVANGKYKNLRDYIDQHGGLESAIKGNAYLKKLFVCDGSNACLDDQLKNVNLLTEGSLIDNFGSSINSSCTNLPTNNIDVKGLREICNAKILKFNTFMVATLVNASSLLKDEYETLQYYADNGNASTKEYLSKSGFAKPYSQWSETASLTTDNNINPAISKLRTVFAGPVAGLFDPLGEFKSSRQTLYSNITHLVPCRASGTQNPNIIGWYPNASLPYITVMCQESGPVVSRYHYNDDSDQVGYVMGVLVGSNRLGSIDASNRSSDTYLGWRTYNSTMAGQEKRLGGYLLPFSYDASTTGFNFAVDAGNPQGNAVMGKLSGNITKSSFSGNDIKLTYNPADIGFNDNYNYMWVRYTSDDGAASSSSTKKAKISRVWKIKHKGTHSTYPEDFIMDSMLCVTADCFGDGEGVRFENGPTIKVDRFQDVQDTEAYIRKWTIN